MTLSIIKGGGETLVTLTCRRSGRYRSRPVLCWAGSTHLLHWGGRSSDQATQPRMSVALYFQRGDVAPFDKTAIPPTAEFQLHDRLAWISASYSDPEVFRFPAADTSPIDS